MIAWLLLAGSGLLAAAGLVIRYMRTPRVIALAISALHLLPTFSPARRDRVRWRFAAPLISWRFWLRAAVIGLLAAALFTQALPFGGTAESRLAVRILVDASPSMRMGTPSRFAQAELLLGELAKRIAALGGCLSVSQWPAASAGPANGVARASLIAALRQDDRDGDCTQPTHLALITDLPRPAAATLASADGEGPPVLWFQLGQPHANVALREARFVPPVRRGGLGTLSVEIEEYGAVERREALALHLTDPDGQVLDPVRPVDFTQAGSKRADYAISRPGRYAARLTDPDGLEADDRLRIEIGSVDALPIRLADRLQDAQLRRVAARLGDTDAPVEGAALVIGPYAAPSAALGAGIYLVPAGGGARPLAFFDEQSDLLEFVDLDLLEAMQPGAIGPLPEGFRVVAGQGGGDGAWIAYRGGADPAVIMPARTAAGAPASDETWWVLFLNAFRLVAEGRLATAGISQVDAEDRVLTDVGHESNTAQEIGDSDMPSSLIPVAAAQEQRVQSWPWLVLAALILLLADRLVGVERRWA